MERKKSLLTIVLIIVLALSILLVLTACNNSSGNLDIPECVDSDNDHQCDDCGKELTVCLDDDSDHNCDICETELTECINDDGNHNCDICGRELNACKDANRDHRCDICGARLTECLDKDVDHVCDMCDTKLSSNCFDSDKDHLCDVCNGEISKCLDKNNDEFCDLCGEFLKFKFNDYSLKYRQITDGTYQVIGVEGSPVFLEIPSMVDGIEVTSIGPNAFANQPYLLKLIIPESITSFGYNFLDSNWKLLEVYNLSSVEYDFANDTGNDKLFVYNSIDAKSIFSVDDDGLISIVDGEEKMLVGMMNTKKVNLIVPNDITTIVFGALANYTGLKKVTIGNSVESIESLAFYNCKGLTSVTIPKKVKSIGARAFDESTSLLDVNIEDMDSWCAISFDGPMANPIYYAKNLYLNDELVLEAVLSKAEEIGPYAFCNYLKLISVSIPSTVKSIGKEAFDGCVRLIEVRNQSQLNIEVGSYGFGGIGLHALNVYKDEDDSKLSTTSNGYILYDNNNLVGYKGSDTNLMIPSEITTISAGAFYDCTNIKSVDIPNSVKQIQSEAFIYCNNLESISIPSSVEYIGEYAFVSCKKLKEVSILAELKDEQMPDSIFYDCPIEKATIRASIVKTIPKENLKTLVISIGESIGAYDFAGCASLTTVIIPEALKSIGEGAFAGCASLTTVIIPEALKSIGEDAFAQCISLKTLATKPENTFVDIPNSVTDIGARAFYECISIEKVVVQAGTTVGDGAFDGCVLKEVTASNAVINEVIKTISRGALRTVTILDGNKIDDFMFEHCTSLENVTIPNTITSIGESAFSNCSLLVKISTPNSDASKIGAQLGNCTTLKKIGASAFKNCTYLTSVTIPGSVESIGKSAFYGCYKLVEVYNLSNLNITNDNDENYSYAGHYALDIYTLANTPSKISVENEGYIVYTTVENEEKDDKEEKDDNEEKDDKEEKTIKKFIGYIGNQTELILPNEVTEVYQYALYKNYLVKKVTLTRSVTSIGNDAFAYCGSLKEVIMGGSLISIGDRAFAHCVSLKNISIDDKVQQIGDQAFARCASLERVTLSTALEEISHNAFISCPIKYANIPAIAIHVIPKEHLKTLVVSNGERIGTSAFEGCTLLTNITILSPIRTIGSRAFYNCGNLVSVNLSSSITDASKDAFLGCPIEFATIPSNLIDSIPKEKIKDLVIAGGGNIKDSALKDFDTMITLTIKSDIESIGKEAFMGCDNLIKVKIETAISTIDEYAFSDCVNLVSIESDSAVTNVGDGAFGGCRNLTTVTIGESLKSIGAYTFYDCSSLTNIVIGNFVVNIGNYAFSGCSSLNQVKMGNLVSTIGWGAFQYCTNLTSITIPNSVTCISEYAFQGCSNLISVTLGQGLEEIKECAFRYCDKLIEVYNLSKLEIEKQSTSNGHVGYYALDVYSSLEDASKISVDEDGYIIYKSRNRQVLIGCNNVGINVVVPNGVTEIYKRAFYGYNNITSVTLPQSLKSIGDNAFYGCYKLIEVYNYSSLNITKRSDSNGAVAKYAFDIYHSEEDESKVSIEGDFIVYESGKTRRLIGYIGNATAIDVPQGITEINDYAFYNCDRLTSIYVPDSVTKIGEGAFKSCNNLVSISIPTSIKVFGDFAFSGCSGLEDVYMSGVTAVIGESFFENCTNINVVLLDISMVSARMFYNCTKLETIIMGPSVEKIEKNAFVGCDALERVYYYGTSDEWEQINVDATNSKLTEATCYYYSETKPVEIGNYWRYVDGEPVAW